MNQGLVLKYQMKNKEKCENENGSGNCSITTYLNDCKTGADASESCCHKFNIEGCTKYKEKADASVCGYKECWHY